jgi:glycyl-tRNA synthetase beta subunit
MWGEHHYPEQMSLVRIVCDQRRRKASIEHSMKALSLACRAACEEPTAF